MENALKISEVFAGGERQGAVRDLSQCRGRDRAGRHAADFKEGEGRLAQRTKRSTPAPQTPRWISWWAFRRRGGSMRFNDALGDSGFGADSRVGSSAPADPSAGDPSA